MTLIYESPFHGWDETGESIGVYELEENEYMDLIAEYEDDHGQMDNDRLLRDMGLFSEWGCVMPGARFTRYYVESLTVHHLVVAQVDALNV